MLWSFPPSPQSLVRSKTVPKSDLEAALRGGAKDTPGKVRVFTPAAHLEGPEKDRVADAPPGPSATDPPDDPSAPLVRASLAALPCMRAHTRVRPNTWAPLCPTACATRRARTENPSLNPRVAGATLGSARRRLPCGQRAAPALALRAGRPPTQAPPGLATGGCVPWSPSAFSSFFAHLGRQRDDGSLDAGHARQRRVRRRGRRGRQHLLDGARRRLLHLWVHAVGTHTHTTPPRVSSVRALGGEWKRPWRTRRAWHRRLQAREPSCNNSPHSLRGHPNRTRLSWDLRSSNQLHPKYTQGDPTGPPKSHLLVLRREALQPAPPQTAPACPGT